MGNGRNQPRIFEKAIQELNFVVGKDRLVQEDDIPKLNYIKACVKEAFRLHPVAPFNIPHVSSIDITVAGYFIPKGSYMLLSRPGLRRNPEVWDDPLTYNPDRHMKSDNEVVLTDHDLDMLSFNTGRRACAGVLLGSTMTIMLLARLLQGFTWELPSNELHVDLKENLKNLSKAKPLLALAKPPRENLRGLSVEEAWETIKDFAQHDKQWRNPTSSIYDQTIANLKAQLVRNEVVRVKIPKCMSWLDAYDEPIGDLEEVKESIGILIEVEPLDHMKLEDLGLNTCSHDLFVSSREIPSIDEPEP
uniref:Valine N-monooxygenase 1-like n=1 Tax=Tanacetum cinerariifolium TaxID=118510 RepID=A0A6L2M935_TANCI|nr:valine N-monooxygenase 1-like [Tanacetum cinerariifolium]